MNTNPGVAADARQKRVQDRVVVVSMQQDEPEEGFEEGRLCHAAQEQVQVGGAGDHLVHRWLQRQETEQKEQVGNKFQMNINKTKNK